MVPSPPPPELLTPSSQIGLLGVARENNAVGVSTTPTFLLSYYYNKMLCSLKTFLLLLLLLLLVLVLVLLDVAQANIIGLSGNKQIKSNWKIPTRDSKHLRQRTHYITRRGLAAAATSSPAPQAVTARC
jgi:hypothetical protein